MTDLNAWINTALRVTGYQFTRRPSVARDIAARKYGWLQNIDIATVLDIGANIGQFAEMIRQIVPQAMIYSFEPLQSCFKILAAKACSLTPMECFAVALGRDEAEKVMYHNDFSPSSSFLTMAERHRAAFPGTSHSVEEKVTVRSLDAMVNDLELKPAILAKIDVQGFELNVLEGAENTLPQIDALIIETSFVELYEGQPPFHDVYRFLHDHCFVYAGSLEQVHDPSNGAILQADSIFLNERIHCR